MAQLFVEESDNGCALNAINHSKPDKFFNGGLLIYLKFVHYNR